MFEEESDLVPVRRRSFLERFVIVSAALAAVIVVLYASAWAMVHTVHESHGPEQRYVYPQTDFK